MGLAHKGSRLSLKDQPVYAEHESTHFNFDMDATGISTGELIEPLEGSVYTHRKKEGRFNSAVAVEEGTINVFPYPLTQEYFGGSVRAKGSYYINDGYKVIATAQPLSSALPGCTLTIGSGESFTVSGYTNLDVIQIYYKGFNASNTAITNQLNINTTKSPNGYFVLTINTGVVDGLSYVNIGVGNPGVADFWMEKVQVEKKAYPTSFTVGARSMGKLDYPLGNVINPSSGTVTMWFNPLAGKPNGYTGIFGVGSWSEDSSKDHLAIIYGSGWGEGKDVKFRYVCSASKKTVDNTLRVNFLPYTWYFIAYSWDVANGIGYCSVTEQGTDRKIESQMNFSTVISPANFINDRVITIAKGESIGSQLANAMYSDIMIDKYALSIEEIERRYISNKPIYNPYDYRAYGV